MRAVIGYSNGKPLGHCNNPVELIATLYAVLVLIWSIMALVLVACCCFLTYIGSIHYWGEPEQAPHLREVQQACLYTYIRTSCRIFLFDATKMATVGEQWLIRCRKIHMTWGTLETTTTCRLLLYTTLTGTPLRRTGPLLSLLRNIIFPAYATQTYIYNGFSHGEAFQSIFSLALQELHMRFLSLIQKKSILCISLWFHISSCSTFAA